MTAVTFRVGQPPRATSRVAVPGHPHRRPSLARRLLAEWVVMVRLHLPYFLMTWGAVWAVFAMFSLILPTSPLFSVAFAVNGIACAAAGALLWRRP